MDSISGIYKIVNNINGKFYVGSAVLIKKRWSRHLSCLRNNKHPNRHLQSAWNKHGENSFVFLLIEKCDKTILIEREQFYIDMLKPEYNLSPTANSTLGVKHTETARKNMSLSHKGMKLSLEWIKNIAEASKKRKYPGRILTQEHKDNIGKANTGKVFSKERRDKIAKALTGNKHNTGRKHTPESIAKMSASAKARKISDEGRAKLSAAHKGIRPSRETIAKRSISLIAAWTRRKANKKIDEL